MNRQGTPHPSGPPHRQGDNAYAGLNVRFGDTECTPKTQAGTCTHGSPVHSEGRKFKASLGVVRNIHSGSWGAAPCSPGPPLVLQRTKQAQRKHFKSPPRRAADSKFTRAWARDPAAPTCPPLGTRWPLLMGPEEHSRETERGRRLCTSGA